MHVVMTKFAAGPEFCLPRNTQQDLDPDLVQELFLEQACAFVGPAEDEEEKAADRRKRQLLEKQLQSKVEKAAADRKKELETKAAKGAAA